LSACCADVDTTCSANSECCAPFVCRGGVCAALGTSGDVCDAADVDADCASGYACEAGTCCADNATGCTSNDQCCTGLVCRSGSCQAAGGQDDVCDETADCTSGYFCENLKCCADDATTCGANDDCCAGLTCISSACAPLSNINGVCNDDGDCLSGTCNASVCCVAANAACTANSECCSDAVCRAGTCQAPGGNGDVCDETADCSGDLICGSSVCCVDDGDTCAANTECCDGQSCIGGACTDLSGLDGICDANDDEDCATGYLCESATCCADEGTTCTIDGDCCSGSVCVDLGSGLECAVIPPPTANPDSYATAGNVLLTVLVAAGVLANDTTLVGTLSVTAFDATSTNGGNVSVAADGSFTYNPAPGFTGQDTFTYTVTGDGGSSIGTVTIDVTGMVWFIDNAVAGPGDGRFTSPFSSIANFNSLAADDPGDTIFIYAGVASYDGNLTLLNSQKLLGEGVGLTHGTVSIAVGSRPDLNVSSGAAITLASGNTVRGLNVQATSGAGISGASVGALTVDTIAITATGGPAASLASGALTVDLDSISSTNSSTSGLILASVTGTFNLDGPSTVSGATASGVAISGVCGGTITLNDLAISTCAVAGVSIAGSGAGITSTIDLNNVDITQSAGFAVDIAGLAGASVDFDAASVISATGGSGIRIANNTTGTNSVTFNGTVDLGTSSVARINGGLAISGNSATTTVTFSNLDVFSNTVTGINAATGTLNITTGQVNSLVAPALDLSSLAAGITLTNVTSAGSNAEGFDLDNVSGSLTIRGTTTIVNAAAAAIDINGGGAAYSFSTPSMVDITNRRGAGININSTTGAIGFGTTSILNPNNVAGDVVTIQNSASDVTFSSLTISNALADAIQLSNNGAGSSLTINGGSITTTAESALDMVTARDISLNNVTINGTGSHGIAGTGVNGFSMSGCSLQNAGDGIGEHGLFFGQATLGNEANLTGTAAITNTTINLFRHNGMLVENFTGALNLTLDNVTFSNNVFGGSGFDGNALQLNADANVFGSPPSMTVLVDNCTFDAIDGDGIIATVENANGATMNITIEDSQFINGQNGDNAVRLNVDGNGNMTYHIRRNTMSNWVGNVISIEEGGPGAVMSGVIDGNTITNSAAGQGIRVLLDPDTATDSFTGTTKISNNVVSGTAFQGIFAQNRDSTVNATLDVAIMGNTVGAPTTALVNGMRVTVSDTTTTCARIENNNATGNGGAQGLSIAVSGLAATFNIEGVSPSPSTAAQAQAYLAGVNVPTTVVVTAGITFTNVNCSADTLA